MPIPLEGIAEKGVGRIYRHGTISSPERRTGKYSLAKQTYTRRSNNSSELHLYSLI